MKIYEGKILANFVSFCVSVRALEKAKSSGSFTNIHSMGASTTNVADYANDSESESDDIDNSNHGRRKRLKTTNWKKKCHYAKRNTKNFLSILSGDSTKNKAYAQT